MDAVLSLVGFVLAFIVGRNIGDAQARQEQVEGGPGSALDLALDRAEEALKDIETALGDLASQAEGAAQRTGWRE